MACPPDNPLVPPFLDPVSTLLNDLLSGYPYTVEGKWFSGKKINLDGYKYARCRFDNCELSISKGTFSLDHCVLANCSIIFSGESLKVARLAASTYQEIRRIWPNMMPTVNEDGAISIK